MNWLDEVKWDANGLVPVIAQAMQALHIAALFGLSPLAFAAIVGGGWGLVAQVTGRWI